MLVDIVLIDLAFVCIQADILICDSCDRGFHVECCKPSLYSEDTGNLFLSR